MTFLHLNVLLVILIINVILIILLILLVHGTIQNQWKTIVFLGWELKMEKKNGSVCILHKIVIITLQELRGIEIIKCLGI